MSALSTWILPFSCALEQFLSHCCDHRQHQGHEWAHTDVNGWSKQVLAEDVIDMGIIWTLTEDLCDVLASTLLHLHWKTSLYSPKLHQNKVWHLGLEETKRWCILMAVSVIFLLLLLIILSDIASKPGLFSHSKSTWLSFDIDHWNYTTGKKCMISFFI